MHRIFFFKKYVFVEGFSTPNVQGLGSFNNVRCGLVHLNTNQTLLESLRGGMNCLGSTCLNSRAQIPSKKSPIYGYRGELYMAPTTGISGPHEAVENIQ